MTLRTFFSRHSTWAALLCAGCGAAPPEAPSSPAIAPSPSAPAPVLDPLAATPAAPPTAPAPPAPQPVTSPFHVVLESKLDLGLYRIKNGLLLDGGSFLTEIRDGKIVRDEKYAKGLPWFRGVTGVA